MLAQLAFRHFVFAALAVQRVEDLEVHSVILGIRNVKGGFCDAELFKARAEVVPVALGGLEACAVILVGHFKAQTLHFVLNIEILVHILVRAVFDPRLGRCAVDFALQDLVFGRDLRSRFVVRNGEVVNVCAGRQLGVVVLCGPVQILIVAARKAEAHGNGQKQRHGNLCDSFHGVCSVPFLNIADKMPTKVCCCSLYRRYGKMSSYFVAGFGAFASSSPQRTFKTSSKTVSGALPPSATLMYGRLPAESITLFGMP